MHSKYGPVYKGKHCVKRRVKRNCICIVVLSFLQAVLSTLFVPTETYGSLKKLSLSVWVLLLITGHWDTRTKNWFSYFFRLTSADYSFWVRCCMVRFIKVKIVLRLRGDATAGGGARRYTLPTGLQCLLWLAGFGRRKAFGTIKIKNKKSVSLPVRDRWLFRPEWYSEESVVVFVESSYHLAFLFFFFFFFFFWFGMCASSVFPVWRRRGLSFRVPWTLLHWTFSISFMPPAVCIKAPDNGP